MIEIIGTFVTIVLEAAKCLASALGCQFGDHLRNYKSNFDELGQKVKTLEIARRRVQDRVNPAINNADEIKHEVSVWQDNVKLILEESEELIRKKEAENGCFKANLKKRHKRGEEASTKVKRITILLEEEANFSEVFISIPPPEIWHTSREGYEAFDSRNHALENILEALKDASIHMVGIYGMGGVGKTTLAKEVDRQVREHKLFEKVVFVEISENPDVEKIQQAIADKLNMEVKNETERANLLYKRLKNGEKILLILDNIWKELFLETVGIPSGPDHGGCKLLFTSRDQDVLAIMGSKTFPIGSLGDEEAWRLFKKMAGDCVENHELKHVATAVVKECGGLPVAIVTVAKALRNKKTFEWEDALEELKRPSPSDSTSLLEPAYSKIEFSYNKLKGDELKKIFLLCSLMTNDASVSTLFNYVMGLDMLDGNTRDKMEKARNRLRKRVRQLKDSCLLLDGDYGSTERFSMHDIVRDVAVSIASRDDCFREWPDKDKLKQCMRISVHGGNISVPLEGLECRKLEFFSMSNTNSSLEITENLFMDMPKLGVLDLPDMKSLSLPSSLCHLVNLQTLCLRCGRFKDVAIIGELKKLKILSLGGSFLRRLPNEIGQLTQLRLLDLSYCWQLEVIAPTVISKLLQLEELYMKGCPVRWEVEGLDPERSNASLEELKHLSRLTIIEIDITDTTILPKGRFFAKMLERYDITIGDNRWPHDVEHLSSRRFKMNLESSIYLEEYLQVVKNVEVLYVRQVQAAKNVFCELEREGFSQLKHLRIWDTDQFVCIVDLTDTVCRDAFPLLESLSLVNLNNLENICRGQLITTQLFNKLKSIRVEGCGKLKKIFSMSVPLTCLQQFQRIGVDSCENMEEIFAVEGEDCVDEIEFSQLRSLTLRYLPQLRTFYSGMSENTQKKLTSTQEPSREIVSENELNIPTSVLFNDKVVFPKLEVLELRNVSAEKIWDNQLSTMSSSYKNLTRLIVKNCQKLEYLFSSFMVQSLEQLQHLEISECNVLKEIVGDRGGAEATSCEFVFPRVTFLKLWHLPELATFYNRVHTSEWPMLKELKIGYCGNLSKNSEENHFNVSRLQPLLLAQKINPNLEKLNLEGLNITLMGLPQLLENHFPKLEVTVRNDKSTNNIPLGILKNPKKLYLYGCWYREIFSCGENEIFDGTPLQIKVLEINWLQDLKSMWKQDSKRDFVLQNLEILKVKYCHKLMNVVPSSASFQNLTTLVVSGCFGLINLITSSTAKSLEQLREMKIASCALLIEVVADKDEVKGEIVFNKLKLLSLNYLGSLISFCSGNHTFIFPSLEELIVFECPNMKNFLGGVLIAPKLQKVMLPTCEMEWSWEGDLNTTIQELHKTKDVGKLI